MKKTILLVAGLLAIIACGDKKDNAPVKNEAVITGQLTAVDSIMLPESLTAYLYNDSKADYDEIEIDVNEDGSFSQVLPVEKTMSLAIYGDFGTQLIASPGDTISIKTNTRFKDIEYSGKGGATNNAIALYIENNPADKLLEGKDSLNPKDYNLVLENALSEIESYNADFLAKNDDPIVANYVAAEETFFIPANKLYYALFSRQGAAAMQDSVFMSSLNNLPEYKEAYDISTNNPGKLTNYIGYAWERSSQDNSAEAREKAFMEHLMSMENNDYLKKKILQSKVMNMLEDNNITFYENHKTRS